MEENKKKNKTLPILIILMGILLIVMGILYPTIFGKNEDNNNNNNNSTTNDTATNNSNENIDDGLWSGEYINGNYSVTIFQNNESSLSVDISFKENITLNSQGIIVDLPTDNKIEYSDEMFGKTISVNIVKNGNSINLTTTSSDEESFLKDLNLVLNKKSFARNGWDGTYKNGNDVIVLSEINEEECGMYASSSSSYGGEILDKENNELNKDLFDDQITITKTEKGILVKSTYVKEGEYIKE